MKILVNYNQETRNLENEKGLYIGSLPHGEEPVEYVEKNISISKLAQLKQAGFSAEEIVEMKSGGVL
jgi:hypothetical protein